MNDFIAAEEQPPVIEIKMVDGIFIKRMFIAKAGTFIPQHAHAYPHATFIAFGSVRIWKDGVLIGDYYAPKGLTIPANCKHLFQALEDGTTLDCIHNIGRRGVVEIAAEHHLVGG